MSKIKLYLASPWFTPEQDERETRVKNRLRELGFEVFSPRDETVLEANASKEDQQKVFEDDINGINDCDAVFAITNTKDMGTLFECGYAFRNGTPLIYFAEGLTGQFNLMLARSGLLVYTNLDNVTYDEIATAIESGVAKEYEGAIE